MEFAVAPSRVSGEVTAPPSKSYTHRGVLAGALSEGTVALRDPLASADPRASARCARLLGADVDEDAGRDADGDGTVWPIAGTAGAPRKPPEVMDCGNSGTTLRLFAGAAALQDGEAELTGDASLRDRPNGPLLEALTALGAPARSRNGDGTAPILVEGPMEGGATSIDGSVSSQFVSSLLFAGACAPEGVELGIEGELKSRPYVDVTVEVMEAFGVAVEETPDGGYRVPGEQTYRADAYQVPGDFSSASYPLAAGALAAEGDADGDGGAVEVANLYPSAQGDSAILDVLEDMGATVDWDRDAGVARVERGALQGIGFDAGDTPDLVPTVAVLGCAASGETRIGGAAHLRHKETDRIEAMATELGKMGGAVEERDDGLLVDGDASELEGAAVDGRHDHRVVMALALAGLVAEGETRIATAESVDISYPGFAGAMRRLGADVETAE